MPKSGGRFGKDHAAYEPYEDLHLSVGAFDGGQCVGPHEYYYKQYDSCSYRWQAAHRATSSDRGLYGRATPAVSAPAPATAASYLRNRALAMAPGPVQTSLAGRTFQLVTGQPFRTAFSPWKNNPHHLLPDAELKNGIIKVSADNAEVVTLIVQGLLNNQYNINHWKNMMILPQLEADGCRMSLPTHPAGDSHPSYSAELKSAVIAALAPYKAVVESMEQKKKDHKLPDPVDVKGELEAISSTVHGTVLAQRPAVAARCASNAEISINAFSSSIATALGV